jgi:hypothetical protein
MNHIVVIGADERGRTVDLLITNYQRPCSWYERKQPFSCIINALILSPHKRSCNQSWYERVCFESHTKPSGTKLAQFLADSLTAGVSSAISKPLNIGTIFPRSGLPEITIPYLPASLVQGRRETARNEIIRTRKLSGEGRYAPCLICRQCRRGESTSPAHHIPHGSASLAPGIYRQRRWVKGSPSADLRGSHFARLSVICCLVLFALGSG